MIKIAPILIFLLFGWLPAGQWQSLAQTESNDSIPAAPASDESASSQVLSETVRIPFLGEVDPTRYALPVLAILLGLIDGFNPCAMWALVYLISLIIGLNDRAKIWFLVGSFVLASGILYFLFMTAWLGAFLIIGYYRPLTLAIGLMAMVFGVHNLIEVARTKGALSCTIGNPDSKQKTQEKMRAIVLSPLTITTMVAIIGLAFLVNSIEFLCSSAIPAVFTHVLAVSNLSWLGYYGYICLYVFFFMLDDMIIFAVAAFTISTTTSLGERYLKFSKVAGGVLLVAIGLLLMFTPEVLR